MKKLIKVTLITLTIGFSASYASGIHGGHGHSHSAPIKAEINKTRVQEIATQEVKRLIINKKIDSSWSAIPISNIKKTKYNYNNEWVVSFENSKIKEKDKQTLYIFVSNYGKITGTNYTGK
ncbi:DUF6488 family protein [Sulfurimonas sp.]|uniref:DUF6488 family protein n=1 Tax=Sulfurimonas sp. TaxID=2022749 RepID=UPI002B47ED45|nr:DUF6488 family protein [Sulfurimonas sp.]